MPSLTDQAYKKAEEVLRKCAHPLGFKASARPSDYHHIWARDSMITLLGALFVQQPKVQNAIEKTFETLRDHQTPLGLIPNNVDVYSKKNDYHAVFDGPSWYIIGHALWQEVSPDKERLERFFPSIEKALTWLAYQDTDMDGLLEMREAGDWEDLFAVHGNGLTVNVLYAQALKAAGRIAAVLGKKKEAQAMEKQAQAVRRHINNHLWIQGGGDWLAGKLPRRIEAEWQTAQLEALLRIRDPSFYLSYLGFHEAGLWCDALGNLLAILFGVADKRQARMILAYMKKRGMDHPYPTKAIFPPIYPGDKDWREYYYKHHLNLPNQYHNAGIWPFIGGFHVAALVKTQQLKEAGEMLRRLAESNRVGIYGEWEFNEWLHGETGIPNGMSHQAWSAAMYIYAYEAVKQKRTPFF